MADTFIFDPSDFTSAGGAQPNLIQLREAVLAPDSGIQTQLDSPPSMNAEGQVGFKFKADLAQEEVDALAGIVADHVPAPEAVVALPVELANAPVTREDGVQYSVPKPSSFGMEMCDRDIRINTCIVDGPSSLEDLKVDTMTHKEVSWNELTLAGVFKLDGGSMVVCSDQADADANGVMTAWDYAAKLPGTEDLIVYEIRDGFILVDPELPTEERWSHRGYAVVAPDIPAHLGGSVCVFDGYLGACQDGVIEALSPQAKVLDPDVAPGASKLRLYIFHPAGSKLSHVLRLVTYRTPGTY